MPIYQGDSYTFTLSLTREDTTVVEITAVSHTASLSTYATYSFNLISGPYLHVGTSIVISGCTNGGNNGTFTIQTLSVESDTATFSINNTSAVTESESVSASGVVYTTPNVTATPVIQIIQATTLTPQLSGINYMIPLDSTNQIWLFTWSIPSVISGEYFAIVSYAADGNIFNSRFVEKIRVGDSYITGTVALDATVAKNATVALAATTATAADVAAIDPAISPTIQTILASTNNLPPDPAGMTLLEATIQDIADLHDAALGSQIIDKTQSPALYTLLRVDSSLLAQFQLTDNTTETTRTSV